MDTIPQDCTPRKRCTGPCGRILPATPEFFNRHKRRKDGLNSQCKQCKQKADTAYRESPEGQARIQAHFSHPEVKKRYRAREKAYRSQPEIYTRDRANEKARRSRPEVQEHDHAYRMEYFSLPEVQEREYVRRRVYNRLPEVKERRCEPHRVANITHRARKKSVSGTHTSEQIQDLLKRQRYCCYYCSDKFEKREDKYIYHIDHTFPISRVAGTAIPANDINYLVLTCPPCNQRKSNKFPWEFFEGGRLL